VIILTINSLHVAFLIFVNGFIFLVGNDFWSTQVYVLQGFLICVSGMLISTVLFYGVLPKKQVKKYYCFCCFKQPEDEEN
jgi:hypothetical protein